MTDGLSTADAILQELQYVPIAQRMDFIKQRLKVVPQEQRILIEAGIALSLGSLPPTPERKELILLIHGIRTDAVWQNVVKKELSHYPNIKVVITGFGYFHIILFLFPLLTRSAPVKKILQELRDAAAENQQYELSVVAHSFGTWIITRILKKHSEIRLRKLLLCGAVVPIEYKWNMLPRFPSLGVLNDVGTKDIWPVLAQVFSWGYGSSGTFGFRTAKVEDRYHNLGHSDFFSEDHIRKYWVPYLVHDKIVESEWTVTRPKQLWILKVLPVIPIKTILLLGFIALFSWHKGYL